MTPGRRRLLIGAGAGVLVLLLAGQLLLPKLCERRVRDQLDDVGTVESVKVKAFPAWSLLGEHADRVEIRMADTRAGQTKLADLLAGTNRTDELDVRVSRLDAVGLELSDVELHKRGGTLEGSATVTDAALRAALPPGFEVTAVSAGDGRLVFDGSADVFGRRFEGSVVALASAGTVLLAPNVPFGGFLSFPVFDDERVQVDEVGAEGRPDGFALTARATLR